MPHSFSVPFTHYTICKNLAIFHCRKSSPRQPFIESTLYRDATERSPPHFLSKNPVLHISKSRYHPPSKQAAAQAKVKEKGKGKGNDTSKDVGGSEATEAWITQLAAVQNAEYAAWRVTATFLNIHRLFKY